MVSKRVFSLIPTLFFTLGIIQATPTLVAIASLGGSSDLPQI
jgi:hypothetical protein